MSFIFTCPNCGRKNEAEDEWEGQRAACPHCHKTIAIEKPKIELRPVQDDSAKNSPIELKPVSDSQQTKQSADGDALAEQLRDAKEQGFVFDKDNAVSNSGNNNFQTISQNANSQNNIATISPFGCYIKVIKNYVGFTGRASRREFWFFTLFNFLISFCIGIIRGAFGAEAILLELLPILYNLAVLLPGLAVGVRRLHDISKSGWWILIALIPNLSLLLVPLVGIILDLVVMIFLSILFFCSEGDHGPNKYGDDPYGTR